MSIPPHPHMISPGDDDDLDRSMTRFAKAAGCLVLVYIAALIILILGIVAAIAYLVVTLA